MLLGVLIWLVTTLFLSRDVIFLGIGLMFGAQFVLRGVLRRRQSFRGILFPAFFIVAVMWWLGWLIMRYLERHP